MQSLRVNRPSLSVFSLQVFAAQGYKINMEKYQLLILDHVIL